MLSKSDFQHVVQNTPLVAFDFVIKNDKCQVLLGLRKNKPACSYWFVPGGRVFKNEKIKEAIERILSDELGIINYDFKYNLLGVYWHNYPDSIFDHILTGTHYIVISIEIFMDLKLSELDVTQHSKFKYMSIEDLILDDSVHEYTKSYFIQFPNNKV